MSSNLRTVALVSQTFAGCASPKRVEERSSGWRGKEREGDRDTGKCNIEFPQGPRGHRSPSWQIYVAGIREVRAVYINLITQNDVTSERLPTPSPARTKNASILQSACIRTLVRVSFASLLRAPEMPLVKLILRFHDRRKRQEKKLALRVFNGNEAHRGFKEISERIRYAGCCGNVMGGKR